MSTHTRGFMKRWMASNLLPPNAVHRHQVARLASQLTRAAEQNGIPLEHLAEEVGDIEGFLDAVITQVRPQ